MPAKITLSEPPFFLCLLTVSFLFLASPVFASEHFTPECIQAVNGSHIYIPNPYPNCDYEGGCSSDGNYWYPAGHVNDTMYYYTLKCNPGFGTPIDYKNSTYHGNPSWINTSGMCSLVGEPNTHALYANMMPYTGYGYVLNPLDQPDTYLGTIQYGACAQPTPTPTPNTSVCAQACGYHFVVPSASGSLAETCFLTSNQNCLLCENVLHLMSEASQYAACSGTEPNVTPTATPTPEPTATPTPYPTSTYIPDVTFAPVWVPTIAHISGGVNLGEVRGKIINSTGVLGNFSASYLDWIDNIVVQITVPVYQIVELIDTPMQWLIDLADTILGIIEGLVDQYLDYAEVPLEVIKMAINSLPDKFKGLLLYAIGLRLLLIGWKGL